MPGRFVRSRTLTVGTSCVVHAALIAALLLAERFILSAPASKPHVLPIEIVTMAETRPPEPVREKEPPPKPVLKKILRLPKPLEPPPLQPMAEAVPAPRPEPPPTLEPPPPVPVVSAPAAITPAPDQQTRAAGRSGTPLAALTDAPASTPPGMSVGDEHGSLAPATSVASIPPTAVAPSSGGNGAIT